MKNQNNPPKAFGIETPIQSNNRRNQSLFLMIISALFVVAIGGFRVLFDNNQHLHLLRGLASGGFDGLSNDWLANTSDPMPVFNFLVQITSEYLGTAVFYLFQFILIAVYLYSILGITDNLFQIRRSKLLYTLFLGIYLFSYSALFNNIFKIDLYSGLAGQYIGFEIFLPNIFAAFIFLSLFLFLKKKHFLAVITVCFAGYIHSGYIISAAVLTASFMIINYLETKNIKDSLRLGILALIIISPLIIYNFRENAMATSEQVFEAARIMVEERIPHHTQVEVWWNTKEVIRVLICIFALWIIRKTKILPLFLFGIIVAFLPVLILTIRPSNTIALLQFWRVSVFLVPLSTTIVIGYLISTFYSSYNKFLEEKQNIVYTFLGGLVVLIISTGINIQINRIEEYRANPANPLYSYINENPATNPIYLLPPKERELQGFRLATETPIFVDWKSHPWNVIEFLDWYEKIQLAMSFYKAQDEQACSILSKITKDYNISHLVDYTEEPPTCSALSLEYKDSKYSIFKVMGNLP